MLTPPNLFPHAPRSPQASRSPSQFKRSFNELNNCWGDEIDFIKNGLCSTFYIVNACAQAAFLVGDVMLLTMAFKKVKRNGGKPAVQNLVYVCNINVMFMLCLCLVYEATSCVKKQISFCACVYDVRIVQYDWSNNRSQALFKTIDHRSRLPNK